MNIGVLGTGMVGRTIAGKLTEQGHAVRLGGRAAGPEQGTFADAAAHGELLFLCVVGSGALDALRAAGAENLRGKVIVDVTNPLDFSKGMPPSLFVSNTDSLGERIQAAFPEARVVKSLNTVNAELMVNPGRLAGGDHTMFLCGDDADAKARTRALLEGFGWRDIVDLGPIHAARATESWLPLWLRLWGALGTAEFNLRIVR